MTFTQRLARPAFAATLALGTALAAPVALTAQTAQPVEPGPEAEVEVGDSELAAFARAALAVSELREAYVERLSAIESEAEQEEVIEEGNMAMLEVIEEEPGMSVERFFEINAAAQADPQLNDRIVMLLQEMATEG